MPVIITSSNNEKLFQEKEVINIGSAQNCDFKLNLDFELLLTLEYNAAENTCTLVNIFANKRVLFKGEPVQKLKIEKVCKLLIDGTDEFVSIKLVSAAETARQTAVENYQQINTELKYTGNQNSGIKTNLEKRKAEIEKTRVSIIKQVGYVINDLKNKISMNSKTTVFLHIAMLLGSIICAFGVSNYLTGLSIVDAKNYLRLPTNIKALVIFSILVFGICLMLKQGVFIYLQNKLNKNTPKTSFIAEKFMLVTSGIFIIAFFVINLIYYTGMNKMPLFAALVSFMFTGVMSVLAAACGYFKSSSTEMTKELNKYEYREDFEAIIKQYQLWIEQYINSLSNTKISYIKDKIFNLQLKSTGETIIGILTAPFLAYGVSNTLAMCFPEAAGWIRISGLRLSPVFLVLATFLIIFAFFSFVNAFLCSKKLQASQVIKNDGFSDYMHHGVTIYGLQGARKLDIEKNRSLIIAICIIFIEFSMNISYFMTEIGGDLQGLFLSFVAALVPTALLIAETYMLSQTKFEIHVMDEINSKLDKD